MARTRLARSGLLLALLLTVQALRLVLPLPPFITMFGIGSAVNACLLAATLFAGWRAALFMAVIAPVVAWLQQMLPLPILIVPVAVANVVYLTVFFWLFRRQRWVAVLAAATAKMAGMYAATDWLLRFVALPELPAKLLRLMFSWPQLVTGVLGGALCILIVERLRKTGVYMPEDDKPSD